MANRRSTKQKKRRNKAYMGEDASVKSQGTTVTRITAPNRNKLSQWYVDNKPGLIVRAVQIAIIAIVGLVVWGITSLIF